MSVLVDNTMELINPYLLKAPDTALSVQSNIAIKKHSKKEISSVRMPTFNYYRKYIAKHSLSVLLTQSLAVFKRIE
ncbi:MAG: hypothetical protein ABJH06_00080 [Paraglaciecola sp.]|uniref:hypothetical protein n=1 Tax=Paraglaciecola sp. TaxID=1920173 RepID=UPI003297F478